MFPGPFLSDLCFYIDMHTLEAFRVDADTDNLSDEEIYALERLILSGAASYFKSVIDQVRDEQVQLEIEEMLIEREGV